MGYNLGHMSPVISRRRAVLEAVRRGARSRNDIERAVGGQSRAVRSGIDDALASGLIHEGTVHFPARGGGRRSGRGLLPGPPSTNSEERAITSAQLRTLRRRAGIGQRRIAESIGVTVALVKHWESGRQAIPSVWSRRLSDAINEQVTADRTDSPAHKHERRVLQALDESEGPLSIRQLLRIVGKDRTTRVALGRLLQRHAIHETVAYVGSKNGNLRTCRAFAVGPSAPEPTTVTMSELRAARRRALWTQARVASELGVSEATFSRWERCLDRPPLYAAASVATVLEELARAEPRPRAEAMELMVATVAEYEHGISVKKLTRELGRHDGLFAEVIQEALDKGELIELVTGARAGRRRLYVGPLPAPLAIVDLPRRRAALDWSQRELAEHAGVSRHVVVALEQGRRIPHPAAVKRLTDALHAGESGRLPRGRAPLRRRGEHADTLLDGLAHPVPWSEFVHSLRAIGSPAPRQVLDGWILSGRVHVYEELSPLGQGRRDRHRMVAPGPGQPSATLTADELVRLRRRAGLSRPQLTAEVGLHDGGGRIGAWENGREPIPSVWAEELRSALARHQPSRAPRVDNVRMSDEELRSLALRLIVEEPGQLSATQLTQRLPGGVRRRWRVLIELQKEGLAHLEPLIYRDSTGRRQRKQVFVLGRCLTGAQPKTTLARLISGTP